MDTRIQPKEQEVQEPTLGQQINWIELFRVKGHKNLHTLVSTVNKSGMVGVMEFMQYGKSKTVKADDLICLGRLVFSTEAGHDDLTMSDVFDNLANFYKETPNGEIKLGDAVPNYDSDEFKPYHLKQVVEWYNELTKKIGDADID